jgi:hypothetical protein
MFKNKKGSALMQVLVLGGVVAGIVVLLLRFSTARMVNVVKTMRKMPAKAYAEGCVAQFTAAAMLRELHGRPPGDGIAGSPNVDLLPGSPSLTYKCKYIVGPATNEGVESTMYFEVVAGGEVTIGTDTYNIPSTLLKMTLNIDTSQLE